MSLVLFRKTMVGAFSGLVVWMAGQTMLAGGGLEADQLLRFSLISGVFGALLSALLCSIEDYYDIDRLDPSNVVVATAFGGTASGLAGYGFGFIMDHLATARGLVTGGQIGFYGSWILVGALIGVASSVRLRGMTVERARNGLLGGLVGGTLGGLLQFASSGLGQGMIPVAAADALGFVTFGASVGAGVGMVPALLAQARLDFVRSEAISARNKLSAIGAFNLSEETYVLGRSALLAGRPGVRPLVIPDPAALPVHAYLVPEGQSYVVRYPPEVNNPAHTDFKPILSKGAPIRDGTRLRHDSDLEIGNTRFRFSLNRRGEIETNAAA